MSHDPHDTPASLIATHATAEEIGPGYEVRDTNVRGVVLFLVGLVLSMVVIQVALWFMLKGMMSEEGPGYAATGAPETIPTTFQFPMTSALHQQLADLRASEAETLGRYGWNGPAGKSPLHVPIDQAIARLAEKGVPPTPGKPRTESELNSHAGAAQPVNAQGKMADPADSKGNPADMGSNKAATQAEPKPKGPPAPQAESKPKDPPLPHTEPAKSQTEAAPKADAKGQPKDDEGAKK